MAKYWANIPGIWSHWWGLCFSHWASCLVFCWSQWYQLVMSPGSLQYLDVYGVSFFILFYSIFFSWSSLSPFILIFPQPVAVICAPSPSPHNFVSLFFISKLGWAEWRRRRRRRRRPTGNEALIPFRRNLSFGHTVTRIRCHKQILVFLRDESLFIFEIKIWLQKKFSIAKVCYAKWSILIGCCKSNDSSFNQLNCFISTFHHEMDSRTRLFISSSLVSSNVIK